MQNEVKGAVKGSRDLLTYLYILGTVKARNFKFGKQSDREVF